MTFRSFSDHTLRYGASAMKNFYLPAIMSLLLAALPAAAENYLLNGGQESVINYRMSQSVTPAASTRKLVLSFVEPASYSSPTYNQKVEGFDLSFSSRPDSREKTRDDHGNTIIKATWNNPPERLTSTAALSVKNSVTLATLKTSAPFPVTGLPREIKPYLAATDQVPAGNDRIKQKSRELTASAKTQFDAVQQILTWQVDHMRYVQPPARYDALYALDSGKGNCQNFSHLAAALMRAAGIPVRIVNGVTLKEPYHIKQPSGTLVMRNAEGRHSWIEVYFPDLKWVPFDPQSMQLFVSNRFIRVEVGLDNDDTENDGLIRWSRLKGTTGKPSFREDISSEFLSDQVELTARNTDYGPRNRLFSPSVEAGFQKTTKDYKEPEPIKLSDEELDQLSYTRSFVFGNLDFPEDLDFSSARPRVEEAPDGTMKMAKNFLVETAEYVTTRGRKYAQSFILQKPMRLKSIGLALHSFSAEGQIWAELLKDNQGIPGQSLATSKMRPVSGIKLSPGYRWVDFDFTDEADRLPPGRYWVALGFTDGPIINWFFSYGKPTGPQDGTRFRTLFDEKWSHSLNFEFNYRVRGLVPKDPVNSDTT